MAAVGTAGAGVAVGATAADNPRGPAVGEGLALRSMTIGGRSPVPVLPAVHAAAESTSRTTGRIFFIDFYPLSRWACRRRRRGHPSFARARGDENADDQKPAAADRGSDELTLDQSVGRVPNYLRNVDHRLDLTGLILLRQKTRLVVPGERRGNDERGGGDPDEGTEQHEDEHRFHDMPPGPARSGARL